MEKMKKKMIHNEVIVNMIKNMKNGDGEDLENDEGSKDTKHMKMDKTRKMNRSVQCTYTAKLVHALFS